MLIPRHRRFKLKTTLRYRRAPPGRCTYRAPLRELAPQAGSGRDRREVSQDRGHTPSTPAELAQHLNVTVADVLTALEARRAYNVSSGRISRRRRRRGDRPADRSRYRRPDLRAVDRGCSTSGTSAGHLAGAHPPDPGLRFTDELSQSQIATEVGLSQMHVSRLLTRALAELKTALSAV